MSERDDIANLLAAYCHALDDGRTDDVVATFCDDATVDIAGQGVHTGVAALRAAYAGWTPRAPQRHVVANTHVTVDGDGARATSDLLFLQKRDDGWRVQLVGRYDDELCRHAGAWRFHRRTATFVN